MTREEILAVAKPILFNTEMVQASQDNRKTAMRRVVKPQPFAVKQDENVPCWCGHFVSESGKVLPDKPPYRPGDILYVRETWCDPSGEGYPYLYKADMPMHWDAEDTEIGVAVDLKAEDYKWSPSIHMPREAARIFLQVTGVRVERLQDITEEQAIQEGIYQLPNDGGIDSGCWTYKTNPYENNPFGKVWSRDEGARNCFRWLWDSTIKPADRSLYGWGANPWVWVIEFEKMEVES